MKNSQSGFMLAALIFFLTATSILIAAAVPYYKMQAKRTLEDELIFRGGEYTRAIQKYQHKTGKYPLTLDALMDTNGIKFLRRQYTDPITGKPFRLLYMNPNGTITGSVLTPPASPFGNQQPASPFGSPSTSGQPGQSGQQNQTSTPTSATAQPGAQSAPSQQQTSTGFGIGGQTGQTGAPGLTPTGSALPPAGTSGIVGVASDSKDDSVMIYNLHTKYNEWEFLATTQQNQQGQPGQPGQTNTNGTTSPTTMPGSSPFGSQPPTTQPAAPFKLP